MDHIKCLKCKYRCKDNKEYPCCLCNTEEYYEEIKGDDDN